MDDPARNNEGSLCGAIPEDIPFLVNHHRMMFEEIQEPSGNPVDLPVLAELENEYCGKLAREIPAGACSA